MKRGSFVPGISKILFPYYAILLCLLASLISCFPKYKPISLSISMPETALTKEIAVISDILIMPNRMSLKCVVDVPQSIEASSAVAAYFKERLTSKGYAFNDEKTYIVLTGSLESRLIFSDDDREKDLKLLPVRESPFYLDPKLPHALHGKDDLPEVLRLLGYSVWNQHSAKNLAGKINDGGILYIVGAGNRFKTRSKIVTKLAYNISSSEIAYGPYERGGGLCIAFADGKTGALYYLGVADLQQSATIDAFKDLTDQILLELENKKLLPP